MGRPGGVGVAPAQVADGTLGGVPTDAAILRGVSPASLGTADLRPGLGLRVDAFAVWPALDPYGGFESEVAPRRDVTARRAPPARRPRRPDVRRSSPGVNMLGWIALGAEVPGPVGPGVVALVAVTSGDQVTTRTGETVRKVAAAGGAR